MIWAVVQYRVTSNGDEFERLYSASSQQEHASRVAYLLSAAEGQSAKYVYKVEEVESEHVVNHLTGRL